MMPKVTIWIKNEDLDKWNAIADRPAWIHEHLSVPGALPVYAMEDIKAGQYGAAYVGLPPSDPTYTDMEDVA